MIGKGTRLSVIAAAHAASATFFDKLREKGVEADVINPEAIEQMHIDESAVLKSKPARRVATNIEQTNAVSTAYGQSPERKMVSKERFCANRWKFVERPVYHHFMRTASREEIALWNMKVEQKKRERFSNRMYRQSAAQKALAKVRDTFDTLREYRHAVRNYAVALLDDIR